MTPFCHLHVHTHYSLLDGATRINELVEAVKKMGMPAVAITDHGNLFGVIEFYEAACKAGIKPVIGLEAYMAPGDRRSKEASSMKEASSHLILLAMNNQGYRNLVKLSSIAYREGFYYKPRIDKEVLGELSEGLLCTSACLGGEIPQALLNENPRQAEEIAKTYLSIFGPERFFIELQDHGLGEQKVINPQLVDLANRLGIATIATNDVHYLNQSDTEAHDVLCCISTGKLLSDQDRFRFENDQFYLKTPEEMSEIFSAYPDAIANTVRVADMCNVEFDFSKRFAPVFKPPDERTPEQMLRDKVYEGAAERYGEITDDIRQRIDYELEVISSKDFASYFLIVWDFFNYAREHGIPCGARGSGCSSVVCYCLGISAPDPLRYGLYFERFMDPDRDEMPDIDADICQNGRSQVIDYVRRKYGHVAQIITFGTLKARAAVKDVSRVLGLGFDEANKLTSLIPAELKMTIDKALDQEPELKKRYENDTQVRRVIDISRKLEGLCRHAGVHAAGVVVADKPLENFLPLYKPPSEDQIVTQFEGPVVEKVGLLKMDFLGLRTLSTLERARQLAEKSTGKSIDLNRLDLTDQKVYQLFVRGETKGVFQFESGGMRDVIMRMRPNRIEDLIAANALYRPGPMINIDAYVARKHGEQWNTPHSIMTEVLQETYGIMVYQEQVSRLVNRLGGIELKRAFRLAKAISKKKVSMIEAEREPFLDGCEEKGIARKTADQIFEDILRFGGYAFNKAHSTGYALVAFQTAYMKAYHPVEFMAALMTFEMSNTDKVVEYIEECRRMGIKVLSPDINTSDNDFTVDRRERQDVVIRFGLAAIKGVGEKAVNAIATERNEKGRFKSLFDFCERVDLTVVNRGTIEALICCGAFDSTGAMRKALTEVLDGAIQTGQAARRDRLAGQMSLFGGDDGESFHPEPKLSTKEWSESEMLAREKAVLGFYVTSHPLASHERLLEACTTAHTVDLKSYDQGAKVVLGGMVSSLRTVTTKAGRKPGSKLGIVTLEDLQGQVEAILFPEMLAEQRAVVTPDAILFFRGEVDRKREEPSLRVGEVITVEHAPTQLATHLLISLADTMIDDALLGTLSDIFRKHAGDKPVYLDITTQDGLVATIGRPGLAVAVDAELIRELTKLLGQQSVTLIGPNRRPIPLPDKWLTPAVSNPTG
ncbi:MAG: DNA polymerase III subunit alpha [Phycisphaerae bacterium]|nr:DNA polymerase III subunit alpha [Phycisphaerae bacterium]